MYVLSVTYDVYISAKMHNSEITLYSYYVLIEFSGPLNILVNWEDVHPKHPKKQSYISMHFLNVIIFTFVL